jgi:methionyl-tRNA synthetase
MNTPKRYLVTSALPYANWIKTHWAFGRRIYSGRYLRSIFATPNKREVVFVCGSDEHGTAIPIQATKEDTTASCNH